MSEHEPKLKILAIDDEPSIRELITVVLEDHYTVITAASGIEGIRMAKSERPDLILLDILMPGHDGIACLQELRAIPETTRLPILMLTALNDVTTRIKAFNAGADDFIPKPFRPDELIARVTAKLTRMRELAKVTPLVLKMGNVVLDLMQARVHVGNQEIEVSPIEFRILSILMRKRGSPINEKEMDAAFCSFSPAPGEVVEGYISAIRGKLAKSNLQLSLSQGAGYALELKSRASR